MFDKEFDVMNEAYKSNVKGKLYRLTYELNKDTRIRVRTAVGDSDPRISYENVTQGSLDAAILSSNGLAKGTGDFFQSSECKVVYETVPLGPLQYVMILVISAMILNPLSLAMTD